MNRKMSPQRVILTLDPVSLWSVTNYMWRGGGGGRACSQHGEPRDEDAPVEVFKEKKKTSILVWLRESKTTTEQLVCCRTETYPRQQSRCCGNRREGLFYHQQISSRQWDKNSTRGHAPV